MVMAKEVPALINQHVAMQLQNVKQGALHFTNNRQSSRLTAGSAQQYLLTGVLC
jgi:hypothetical protein